MNKLTVGNLKNRSPKIICSLVPIAIGILWLLYLFQDKESNIDFGRTKEPKRSGARRSQMNKSNWRSKNEQINRGQSEKRSKSNTEKIIREHLKK